MSLSTTIHVTRNTIQAIYHPVPELLLHDERNFLESSRKSMYSASFSFLLLNQGICLDSYRYISS